MLVHWNSKLASLRYRGSDQNLDNFVELLPLKLALLINLINLIQLY